MTLAIALAWLQANWKPVLLGLLCFVLGWFLHPKGAAPIAGSAVSTSQSSSASAGAEIKIPCGDKEVIVRYDCKGQNASSVSATAQCQPTKMYKVWIGGGADNLLHPYVDLDFQAGRFGIRAYKAFDGTWGAGGKVALFEF